MPANTQPHYVGLDIAKAQLDYCLDEIAEGRCANTAEGRKEFLGYLQSLPQPRVICEASGGYEKLVVAELLAAGIEVCIVQPVRVRSFAHAEGLFAKNDQIDARLLRRFGQKVDPRLAQPSDPAAALLRELLDLRRQLTNQLSELQCRRELAGAVMAKSHQRQETFLRKEVARVEKQITAQIKNDPDLHQKYERLQEVKGIGPVLAATVLAYVPELGLLSDSQLSALIGVAPYAHDSGTTKGRRHIWGGRAQVRHVLYMAATCAATYNPILARFYQRLLANGKAPKQCLVAVMRKLVCLMNRLIQDPNFVLVS